MRFDTLYFLCFFAVVWTIWRLSPRHALVLLIASAVFYYVDSGRRDAVLFFGLIAVNFGVSLMAHRGLWLATGIAANISVLAFFKYRQFVFGDTWLGETFTSGLFVNLAIPLGISFYTFQAIAYFVDIYRGEVRVERSFPRFFLFKAFFPQLIAGPIVRAWQLMPQLTRQWCGQTRRLRLTMFGLVLACAGVVKKIVFADSIAPFVDDIFTNGPANAITAWIGAALFAFQIYFDFAGYSDMALGMAYLLGVRLPMNFRQPYLSTSPREFWQRWHITLSTWIRDYLYIPLGGNKGGPLRQTAVVLAVMAIAGFWHGANWTFMMWGLGWGLVIAIWRIPSVRAMPGHVGWLLTTLIAILLWVPFRAADLTSARVYFAAMFGGGVAGTADFAPQGWLAVAGITALFLLQYAEARAYGAALVRFLRHVNGPLAWGATTAVITWLLVMPKLVNAPFIYFRF